MQSLRFTVVAAALSLFGIVTFSVCLLWDLAFPSLAMTRMWQVLLPGFQGITWGSYVLGVVMVVLYGIYTAAVFVPLYNFLSRRLP